MAVADPVIGEVAVVAVRGTQADGSGGSHPCSSYA